MLLNSIKVKIEQGEHFDEKISNNLKVYYSVCGGYVACCKYLTL